MRHFALIAIAVLTLAPGTSWSCPFCSPIEGETLLSQIDSARSVVLATLVRQPSQEANGERQKTVGFGIIQVARATPDLDSAAIIELPLSTTAPVGSRYLLLQMRDKSGTWQRHFISPRRWEFVRAAAQLPVVATDMSVDDRAQRLAFCLPHLVSDTDALAKSAYCEFAAASCAAVKKLAPQLDSRELRKWIGDEERTSAERSLLFTLLGICGDADDVAFIEAAFEDGLVNRKSTELASIIAAWISITGSEGLDEIDRRLLGPKDVPSTRRRAAVEALRFHANVEGTVIEESRVIASARLLLAHPDAADFIICDLAEWEDWDSLPAILNLWKTREQNRWLKAPILKYLRACPLADARKALQSDKVADTRRVP